MLARKKREEISIFLFSEGKRIATFGQIIYPLLIIYHINITLKGEIAYSTEATVTLAVTKFLEDFSYHIKPWLISLNGCAKHQLCHSRP